MKICYVPRKFQSKSQNIIDKANQIIEEYQSQGYELTVRQLYYQFVARGFLSNNIKSYGFLSGIINKARLAGQVDWNAIIDRTRNTVENQHWDSPKQIIDACAYSYKIDTRETQPIYLEVWVEKEALAGVIEKTCNQLDILSFACRGYVSQSAMWQAAQRIRIKEGNDKKTIILHFGDHDPSGMDMTRDIQDRLDLFGCSARIERIALNMDQIEKHQPPPNPIKPTDSRSGTYGDEYGDDSWELDALEPKILDELIRDQIDIYTDSSLLKEAEELQEEEREVLNKIANDL